ncbi:hypothetical protein PWT90_03148 [Aphanocladium album]|nr:hypothetical protein PWT90_03148 [Aphanocladium album]
MANDVRHAAESDPLLPPADFINAAESETSNTVGDALVDDRTVKERLRIAIPCLLAYFCLIIGDELTTTPVLQIRENIICRNMFPEISPGADLNKHPLCKSNPVQAELALIGGWELTFVMIPSILTGVPWGIAADKYGRGRILQLANLGVLLSFLWQIVVYSFPDAIPLRWVWLQGIFFLIGGGASTYGALLFTVASDISSEAYRATALLWLGTATNVASFVGGPIAYFAMQRGAWFGLYLGVALWLLLFVLTALVPETRCDAAVKKARENALQESIDVTKHAWWDVRPMIASTVEQTKMVTNVIFLNNASLAILLFSTVFTTLGKAGSILEKQYASKRFGWDLAETSFLSSVKGIIAIVLTAVVLPAISHLLIAKFKLPPIVKDWWMTIGSLCLLILGSACLTAAGNSTLFLISLMIVQLGGGYEFSFRSMVAEMVDASHIAMLFTAYSVFMLISEVGAGPVLASVFKKGLDIGGKWMALPFFVATLLFCVTLIITCSVRLNKHPKAQRASH